MKRILTACSIAVLLGIVQGCDSSTAENPLKDGILSTFQVGSSQFKIWVTNTTTIEEIFALRRGESQASIPIGIVLRGSGDGGHNEPWSWHIDPERVAMAEITIELCDAAPGFVESNLDAWMENVGQYCPWSAELTEIQDFR